MLAASIAERGRCSNMWQAEEERSMSFIAWCLKKDFQRLWHQIRAKCGPDLLTSSSWPLPRSGGDGVGVRF